MQRTTKNVLVLGSLVLVLALAALVAFAPGYAWCAELAAMPRIWGMGGFRGMMFMPFVGLLGLGLLVWLLYLAFRQRPSTPSRTVAKGDDAALAILRKRFAQGDITREEFEERRAALEETL